MYFYLEIRISSMVTYEFRNCQKEWLPRSLRMVTRDNQLRVVLKINYDDDDDDDDELMMNQQISYRILILV